MKFRVFLIVVVALCFALSFTESHAVTAGEPLSGIVGVNLTNKTTYPVSVVLQCYYYSHIAGQEGGSYNTKAAMIPPGTSQKVTCCSRSIDKNNSRREFTSCDPKKLDGTVLSFPTRAMNTFSSFPEHDNTVLIWNVDILPNGLNANFQFSP